jgi:hypothetical protein
VPVKQVNFAPVERLAQDFNFEFDVQAQVVHGVYLSEEGEDEHRPGVRRPGIKVLRLH